jgi:hypothetical protein
MDSTDGPFREEGSLNSAKGLAIVASTSGYVFISSDFLYAATCRPPSTHHSVLAACASTRLSGTIVQPDDFVPNRTAFVSVS